MFDGELEQRLFDYYRAEADDDGPSASLLSAIASIPERAPASTFGGRRGLLLAAAALLVALLAGTAIAVGLGLIGPFRTSNIELPVPSAPEPYALAPQSFTTAASFEGCYPYGPLPDGTVAFLWTSIAVGGQGPGVKAVWVFDDGRVLIAQLGDAPEQAWTQRQLTEPGFNELLDALVQPNLPSCRPYNIGDTAPDQFILSVQAPQGVYAIHLAPAGDPLEAHVTTPDQVATINDMVRRLADSDLGLAPAAWADASWTPYVSQTWQLQVDMTGDGGPGAPLLTEALKLPDGTPLLQVGDVDPTAQERGVQSARCAMVDYGTAKAVLDQLPPKNVPGSWDFSNATVTLQPTLPGAQCPTQAEVTPSPPQEPSTTAPSGTDVCGFLSADAAQRVLGDPKLATSSQAWTNGGLDGWSGCLYGSDYARGLSDERQGTLLVHLQAVPGDQAEALARGLFGSQNTTSVEIAGDPVFSNGCDPQTDQVGCNPSVAISLDPDFIVLDWAGGSQDDLLALATALIQGAGSGPAG